MKYTFRDLLTLLIGLFILGGCENPSLVGLDVNPEDQLLGDLIDTVTIHTKTIPSDSIVTPGSSQFPLGFMQDPIIGSSAAELAFGIAPNDGDSRIPLGVIIDSAILVVNYGNDFTGDSTNSTNQIEVYQLEDAYALGEQYYNTASIPHQTDPLGSVSIHRYAYKDSVRISTVENNQDTSINVIPQMRIPLDGEKLRSIFSGSYDSAEFADGNTFHNLVKGFKIKVNQDAQVGVGGIVNLNVGTGNGLYVYYRHEEDTVRRTNYYAMNRSQTMGSVQHQFSPEVEAQMAEDAGEIQEKVYVAGPLGVNTQISFPFLDQLKGLGIVVNKAELVLYPDPSALEESFPTPAPRLTLFQRDLAGQPKPIPDGDTRQNYDPRSFGVGFGGFYQEEPQQYTFILTSFIQDYLMDKFTSPSVYIGPASPLDEQTVPYLPVINAASRAILSGNAGGSFDMQLKIYYTKKNNQ